MMNCVFSAKRGNIVVDACAVSIQDSVLCQQAAHITDGIYHRPVKRRMSSLSEVLLCSFGTSKRHRELLLLVPQV